MRTSHRQSPPLDGQVEQDRSAVLCCGGFTHVFGARRSRNFERRSNPDSRRDLSHRNHVEGRIVPRPELFARKAVTNPMCSVGPPLKPFGVVLRPAGRPSVDADDDLDGLFLSHSLHELLH